MNFYDKFTIWFDTGNEIEFTYKGEEYSVTYTSDEKISFCKFNCEPKIFDTADDFMNTATIENERLSDIWNSVVDIYVY